MNVYDSNKIEDLLTNSGYLKSSNTQDADILIFYTYSFIHAT